MAADDPTFPAIGISRGGTAAVLAQIGPSLYRANAFRLIGLPVEASAQDVRRRAEALRMSESIGAAPPPGFEPLPPTERPSADEVREALQRVQDPETRVVEELFWFWPMNPGESRIDRALAATAAGDFATACGLWRNTPAGGVGLHNLAVLSHAVALDHEAGETRQALDLVDEDRDYLQRLWRQTHLDWTAVLDEPAFWQRFADRIREVDDPRLTAATVSAVRAILPRAILSINARLAIGASERRQIADRTRHLALVRQRSVDSGTADEVLRATLGPVTQRLDALCKAAEADAGTDPGQAAHVTTRLLDQADPLISAIDTLPKDHPTRNAARDGVARASLRCQIIYGNKTKDWTASLALLQRALDFAAGESVRTDIKKNIDILEGNLTFDTEMNTCWFCQKQVPDETAAVVVDMHGEVTRVGGQVSWRTGKVKVPRCGQCRSKHGRGAGFGMLAFLTTALTGFGYCGAGNGEGVALGIGWAMFIAAFFVFVGVDRAVRGGIRDETQSKQFPAVLRLVAEGFAVGAKPPGAS